jgi:hypothetical protein
MLRIALVPFFVWFLLADAPGLLEPAAVASVLVTLLGYILWATVR